MTKVEQTPRLSDPARSDSLAKQLEPPYAGIIASLFVTENKSAEALAFMLTLIKRLAPANRKNFDPRLNISAASVLLAHPAPAPSPSPPPARQSPVAVLGLTPMELAVPTPTAAPPLPVAVG